MNGLIPVTVPMTLAVDSVAVPIGVTNDNVSLTVGVGLSYASSDYPYYTGEYEFTPTQDTQTVQTKGHVLTEDIVINPIPSNYGLITWNGSVLTVS